MSFGSKENAQIAHGNRDTVIRVIGKFVQGAKWGYNFLHLLDSDA